MKYWQLVCRAYRGDLGLYFSQGFLPLYESPSRAVAGRPGLGAETFLFSGAWLPALALMHHCFSSLCTAQAVTWKSPDVGEPGPGRLLARSSHTPHLCLWHACSRSGGEASAMCRMLWLAWARLHLGPLHLLSQCGIRACAL